MLWCASDSSTLGHKRYADLMSDRPQVIALHAYVCMAITRGRKVGDAFFWRTSFRSMDISGALCPLQAQTESRTDTRPCSRSLVFKMIVSKLGEIFSSHRWLSDHPHPERLAFVMLKLRNFVPQSKSPSLHSRYLYKEHFEAPEEFASQGAPHYIVCFLDLLILSIHCCQSQLNHCQILLSRSK